MKRGDAEVVWILDVFQGNGQLTAFIIVTVFVRRGSQQREVTEGGGVQSLWILDLWQRSCHPSAVVIIERTLELT